MQGRVCSNRSRKGPRRQWRPSTLPSRHVLFCHPSGHRQDWPGQQHDLYDYVLSHRAALVGKGSFFHQRWNFLQTCPVHYSRSSMLSLYWLMKWVLSVFLFSGTWANLLRVQVRRCPPHVASTSIYPTDILFWFLPSEWAPLLKAAPPGVCGVVLTSESRSCCGAMTLKLSLLCFCACSLALRK